MNDNAPNYVNETEIQKNVYNKKNKQCMNVGKNVFI